MKKEVQVKNVIVITTLVLFIIICTLILLLTNEGEELLKVKDAVVFEYGEVIRDEVGHYLNTGDLSREEKAIVLSTTKLDMKSVKIETNKKYPKLGQYTIKLRYKNEEKTVKVFVKDTIPSVFYEIDTIEMI